jgi:hypothetical protein
LTIPDTWEVEISKNKNNKESWERLLKENKLGALALLRNLRNMQNANVDMALIKTAIENMKTERVLPYRFIAAAKYAPMIESTIEATMIKCFEGRQKLLGDTIILVDVSGSMKDPISEKSDMTRMEAACGLAILARETFKDVKIFTFSNELTIVPDRHGFALRDSIINSQSHSGTYLGRALNVINDKFAYDRLICITDEQSHDTIPNPKVIGYIINVASCKNGIGYGPWTHISGWSESVLDYIVESENSTK